jgi:hypothetical protein
MEALTEVDFKGEWRKFPESLPSPILLSIFIEFDKIMGTLYPCCLSKPVDVCSQMFFQI